ncbi:hypothetical protein GCM10027046_33080 [Uliginosibacterium flavum]|uniref:Uncharacterized protein n=1 Tax=Uliginosibacterium flavum TaxID=1396831 RepID=A0ABV2TPR6_9RHOO
MKFKCTFEQRVFMRQFFTLALLTIVLSGCGPFIRTTKGGSEIVFDGAITKESVAKFKEELAASPKAKKLMIRSRGGDAEAGIDIGDLVFQRHLDVEVKDHCMSACANYIFPAGRAKVIPKDALVAWHGRGFAHAVHVIQTREVPAPVDKPLEHFEIPDAEKKAFVDKIINAMIDQRSKEEDFYKKIGVNSFIAWIGRIPPYQAEDFYTMSPADMAKFGVSRVQADAGYENSDFSQRTSSKLVVIKVGDEVSPPVIANPKRPEEWFTWK